MISIPAPVARDDQVGVVRIEVPGLAFNDIPLFAGADIEKADFFGRVTERSNILSSGRPEN